MVENIADGMEKKVSAVYDLLGIVTDEEVSATLPALMSEKVSKK